MKPHKGIIMGRRFDVGDFEDLYGKNLGYIVHGRFNNHPQFGMSLGQTSLVVKKGRWKNNQCEIETLNSRYTWIRPARG